jgi:hypothetical protein
MSHKHNKRRGALNNAKRGATPNAAAFSLATAFNNLPMELRKATLEASLPSFGLSKADLSAAPDHCRTVIDVYMWKMNLPRDVAEARLAEIIQGTSQDEADRVLAPFGL